MKNQEPVTHIVKSRDAAGHLHHTPCSSEAEAVKIRRKMRDVYSHLTAIIVTVEIVTIPTSTGPVIGYRPAIDAPAKRPALHRQAVR